MWIEIIIFYFFFVRYIVTPFAGVWIEIISKMAREKIEEYVTPFAGVWIEIILLLTYTL